MTQLELEPQFIQCLKLLHSSNKDSAEQLRIMLDDTIKSKYGPSKMLSNVLHKKYMIEESVTSDVGSNKKSKTSSSKHSNKSSKSSSPVNIPTRDTPPDILQSDDTFALEILEDDLTCVICKGMDVGARNRLVECVECHALYHQECHVPHIQDSQIDTPRQVWYCSNCSKTQVVPKERSSPKPEGKSKESKKTPSNSGPKATPNIHIISADKRLKDMMKKAKQDKRNSSSSSGSKHSSNSSSTSQSSKSSQDKSYKNKSNMD